VVQASPCGAGSLRWRGVAQPGSALALGARGPRFESGRPDQSREFATVAPLNGVRGRILWRARPAPASRALRTPDCDHIPNSPPTGLEQPTSLPSVPAGFLRFPLVACHVAPFVFVFVNPAQIVLARSAKSGRLARSATRGLRDSQPEAAFPLWGLGSLSCPAPQEHVVWIVDHTDRVKLDPPARGHAPGLPGHIARRRGRAPGPWPPEPWFAHREDQWSTSLSAPLKHLNRPNTAAERRRNGFGGCQTMRGYEFTVVLERDEDGRFVAIVLPSRVAIPRGKQRKKRAG
jgi:hypothetical protein